MFIAFWNVSLEAERYLYWLLDLLCLGLGYLGDVYIR